MRAAPGGIRQDACACWAHAEGAPAQDGGGAEAGGHRQGGQPAAAAAEAPDLVQLIRNCGHRPGVQPAAAAAQAPDLEQLIRYCGLASRSQSGVDLTVLLAAT